MDYVESGQQQIRDGGIAQFHGFGAFRQRAVLTRDLQAGSPPPH